MHNRSDSRIVPQTEEQRLLELKLRIWGTVAVNLLNQKKDPHVIAGSKIESHRGRVGKALKDLRGLVSPAGSIKDTRYGSTSTTKAYRVHDFETQSADLAVAPEFITTWQQFHDDIFTGYGICDQQTFDRVGYRTLEELSNAGAIYVYWHQEEYEFITGTDVGTTSTYVYPRAQTETRIKAMLRAIVESHYQDDYGTKLERYLGIPEGSLKRSDKYRIEVRNFCARAADLSAERYYGTSGFHAEYMHHKEYMDALMYNLNKLNLLIQSKGGFENITREMRRASIEELLIDAPLRLTYDDDEIRQTVIASYEYTVNKKKYPSTFLLRHSAYFNYDTLYATDESVTYIDDGHADTQKGSLYAKEHGYTPDENECRIIETYRKDIACTLQKNTSGVLQPT